MKLYYFLKGKLYCGHCGTEMIGECVASHTRRRSYYYICPNAKRDCTCTKKSILKDWIEEIVFEESMPLLNPKTIDELAEMAVSAARRDFEQNAAISSLEREFESNRKRIDNLLKEVEKGDATETTLSRICQLQQQQNDLKKRLSEEAENVVLISHDDVKGWLSKLLFGDYKSPEFRRNLVRLLISKVTVWDHTDGHCDIKMHFNLLSQKTKEISCDFGSGSETYDPLIGR